MSAVEIAQEFETGWWGDCTLTFGEEAKQITYGHRMGLVNEPWAGKWPCYDLEHRSVLDLGGGPVSMLLKTRNGGDLTVVDPCPYPAWIAARYEHAGIKYIVESAEKFVSHDRYDEVWIYNVLQHVIDPEECIECAREHGKLLRIFEWLDAEKDVAHPHTLRKADLDRWIGGNGEVEVVNENGATGSAYYGVFAF